MALRFLFLHFVFRRFSSPRNELLLSFRDSWGLQISFMDSTLRIKDSYQRKFQPQEYSSQYQIKYHRPLHAAIHV